MTTPGALRVALVGAGGIGRRHAQAWQRLRLHPDFAGVRVTTLASRTARPGDLDAPRVVAGWRDVVGDPDVDLVDVCVPDDLHAEIAAAALLAGRHVVCEKPLGRTGGESARLADLAAAGPGLGFVPFVYRSVPAFARAGDLIAAGAVGTVTEVRGHYLQSWLFGAEPGSWRMDPGRGSGVRGDLASHLLDACGFLVPGLGRPGRVAVAALPDPLRRASWTAAFPGGAVGTFSVSRTAPGHVNDLTIEVAGDRGGLRVSAERPDEVVLLGTNGSRRTLRVDDMTDGDWLRRWRPRGTVVGWSDPFVTFLSDVAARVLGLDGAAGAGPPTFADAARVDADLELIDDERGELT